MQGQNKIFNRKERALNVVVELVTRLQLPNTIEVKLHVHKIDVVVLITLETAGSFGV